MARLNYGKLSAVAWVGLNWVLMLFILVTTINVVSVAWSDDDAFWVIFPCLVAIVGVLSYPYYHYRKQGGYVKRMPPRSVQNKPAFEKSVGA